MSVLATVPAVISLMGNAYGHRVILSIHVSRYWYPCEISNGPMSSMCTTSKRALRDLNESMGPWYV